MGPGWTSSTVTYAYDPAGRLQTLSHDLAGTSRDHGLGFADNPAGQIVTRTGEQRRLRLERAGSPPTAPTP